MIREFIERHRQEMIESLQGLLRIPSVKGPAQPGRPFGDGPAEALSYALQYAAKHGFRVADIDGYAGHVELGDAEGYVAVLSHLDVVPVGPGWTYPPFAAEIHDERVYARGAIDDKGPAWSALWALIALKELGWTTKRKVRLIFGLDEESDWQCVRHYFSKQPAPLAGFTPDADFPLIFAEKGVATLCLEMPADKDSMAPCVTRFHGGDRPNMVPDAAEIEIDCHSETAAREWEQQLHKEARQRHMELVIKRESSQLQVSVRGVSAHGSTPEKGVNAIVQLATLLTNRNVANASMWRMIASQDTWGKALGLDTEDDITGPLTSNLGCAELIDGRFRFWFNIRYPIGARVGELIEKCQEYVSDRWSVSLENDMPPHYVPLDSPVVQVLQRVYEQHTGAPAQPLAIGGATYARAIPNAVAFGPLFPGQPDLAHRRDEYWGIHDFLRCVEIYAHAIHELANTL
ncbi:dipeptidase PepV [Alicyclobacillus kakegawensis]|uniref:dipeptidase PepV n=1 Tax=Alicyclobacillus kakegawensis TaxID=392012 RepID=UPI00082CAF66|nr:dipeptidase PepV [Alicyclobacillus kakegawensis]